MIDPGLAGCHDRPVPGIDNGYVAGYRVRFDEAGPDGRIRTSALLRYAQDVAWRHSEDLGFDRQWYLERGRWWVVRAVELELLAAIPMGRTLRVSTAVVGHRRIWARRLSEVRLADAELAARVITDWVLIDDDGRIVRIPGDFGLSFRSPELAGEIMKVALDGPPRPGGAAGVTEADGTSGSAVVRFRVRPQDLDPMGHVNNAAYLDWLEEALLQAPPGGLGVTDLPRLARLEYRASAEPGDEIVVSAWRDGGSWQARIERPSGEELLRAAGVAGEAVDGTAHRRG